MAFAAPETGARRLLPALVRKCSIGGARGRPRAVCGDLRNLRVESMKPYNSKNRPRWAAPKRDYPTRVDPAPAFMVARSTFGDFSEGSGRRQCKSVARSTGERCRRDAVQGCERCGTHGGLTTIGKRLAKLGYSAATPNRRIRRRLADLGAGEPPQGFPEASLAHLSPLRRGQLFEAFENRAWAPDAWRAARIWLEC